MSANLRVTVIGAGAWGTALAEVAARSGCNTRLWGRDQALVDKINTDHENPKCLPGLRLDEKLVGINDLEAALDGIEMVFLAVPTQASAEIVTALAPLLAPSVPVVCCAKGIEQKSRRFPANIVADLLPDNPVAVLSGPGFAAEVARGLPTAVTVACDNMAIAERVGEALSDPRFRIYTSVDVTGAEIGGALKNVLAIAVGAARAMQLGASAEAALIARGFAELQRIGLALGAKPQTLAGLSGLGDLVLTCSSPQSRNFSYGMALAAGTLTQNQPLAEGVFTATSAAELARRHGLHAPIISAVDAVLGGRLEAREAVETLLARAERTETV